MWWFTLLIALCSAVAGFAAGQALECLHANPRNVRKARSEAYDKGWVDGYDIGTKVRTAQSITAEEPKPKKPKKISARKKAAS